MKEPPLVIGAAELVDLPDWHIADLRAKVDTGARSSALHVENIREVGRDRVRFDVRLHRRKRDRTVHVEAAITRRGRVRPSSGHGQMRLFVTTTLRIGSVERQVELSLVDREKMIYRMLIGRTALAHGFLVDPGRRYVLTHDRHHAKKKKKVMAKKKRKKKRRAPADSPRVANPLVPR